MNEATESQIINPIPPESDGSLLVPADSSDKTDEFRHLKENEHFSAFLNRIAEYATARSNSPAQWERRRKTVKLRKYLCGEYYGIFDKSRGWINGKDEGDGIYFNPQTATFLHSLLATLVKTKPIKRCAARDTDSVEKREAARVAETILKTDDEQIFTPKRQQREWLWNLLCAGENYRLTYFNPNKTGCGVSEEVFEPQMIAGGDKAYYCAICSGNIADESGRCAGCKNPQMDSFETLGTTISIKQGKKYKQIGDVDWDSPDALEMTVIGETDDISEALVVMRDRIIPRCVLEDALDTNNLPETDFPDALHYKQLFDQNDSFENSSSAPEFQPLHYQEFWIAPAVYTSYKFPQDTLTRSGQKIPKGTRAKDIFPEGLYFSRVKMRICQLFPQKARDAWTHTVNAIGEGFHGQGEWDLAEMQDQLTEAHSMKMNSMLLDSTQPLTIREGYVDTENFENKFGLIVPVSQDYPLEHKLENLMSRVQSAKPPSEAFAIGEEIRGAMQSRVGAMSNSGSDMPDAQAIQNTATGYQLYYEHTLGRRAPALQLYAQMEVEQAYQKLEMRQKYWCKKMYAGAARDTGDAAVDWFIKSNIRQDFLITVVPDSWMPQTDAQKKLNFESLMNLMGEILIAKGDPAILDELMRKANEIYGAEIDFNDLQKDQTEAQLRLDKLKEVGEFVENRLGEMTIDPMTGAINPDALMLAFTQTAEILRLAHPAAEDGFDIFSGLPLDVMFDTHAEFTESYSDWLKSAQGRAASQFIRSLVRALADYHIQAESYRQMKLARYQMITQAPQLEAEMMANEVMNEQQAPQAEAAEQKQAETRAVDLEEAERDRMHEREMKQMETEARKSAA